MANALAALCAVGSFLWIAHNLEDHQIIEHPRLSSLLVLLIASIACYAVSFGAAWLPGTHGRFDDELLPSKPRRLNLPPKPRRYFLPGLAIALLLRLELFHRVTLDLQCSAQGIEAFLPLAILLYELLPGRRTRPGRTTAAADGDDDDDDDHDDFGATIFDALGSWFTESRSSLTMAVVMLSLGTYLAASQDPRSTFFCASRDASYLVVFFQWLGLLLDAAIAIMLWRVLAWSRTTKSRLRTLSGLLLAASLGTAFFYWASRVYLPSPAESYSFRGLGSLYAFDVAFDGLALSVFLVATALMTAEGGGPLTLAATITFLLGLTEAVRRTWLAGTWENVSPATVYLALTLVCVGFSCFAYANNVVTVVFVHRALVVFLLVAVTVVAAIYTPVKALRVVGQHPISRLMYDARTEANRWLVRAAVSDSLRVAVDEYKERHNGRAPPPKFDAWYDFAKQRRSLVIDHFPQIENDLLPFWGLSPAALRDGVRRAAEEPSMALLEIKGGQARHNLPPGSPDLPVINDLLALIKDFAEHLPDMELAVNLDERPRVLPPADVVQRCLRNAGRKRAGRLFPRAAGPNANATADAGSEPAAGAEPEPEPEPAAVKRAVHDEAPTPDGGFFTSAAALREMTALTCPTGTRGRAGTHWDVRDFCASCAAPHSQGQYLADWERAQDICHQPDLFRLHGFHMTPSPLRPLQELLPVFGRSKTDSYRDILLPLRRIAEPPPPPHEPFDVKHKSVAWRGKVDRVSTTYDQFRGGHQERLVHLLSRPARSDRSRVQLVLQDRDTKATRVELHQVATGAANDFLPLDVAFSSYAPCRAAGGGQARCAAAGVDPAAEFRIADAAEGPAAALNDPLSHRYVLLVDTDHGPPRDLLRALRSGSAPIVASLFREWYTDRLRPWVHFVPLDLRYHALHATIAYFAGVEKERGGFRLVQSSGADVAMPGRDDDGRWIAEEGQKWADKALRREDAQVYLFRLLLEWGRIVSDERDALMFVL
ncbi:hypothetical protein VTJ83DRAFT_400 [Remersonia thermophila]|uniref:Glycosyl transferase CAP10 domain-containing protein n=1 Tax=Remersonia thermophila TaxID=72144 RepID=A0ABR4DKY4_9PEZI